MLGKIAENYYIEKKLSCAQSIFFAASDMYKLGLTAEDAKLVSGFAGGMGCGSLCGALAGSISVMGKLLLTDEAAYTMQLKEACAGFVNAFNKKFTSTLCSEISPKFKTEQRRCGEVVFLCGEMLEEYLKPFLQKNN